MGRNYLSNNNCIGELGAKYLGESLSNLTQLEELILFL